jgi:choline dehydrogenase-like flavoprotein
LPPASPQVQNPRLLPLSTSRSFAQGLANTSGLVGKFFMSHPSVDVTGRSRENVHPYRIGFSTAMSRQFAIERERGARGAFLLEFLNSAGPTPEQLAGGSGLRGEALRRHVRDEFGRRLGIGVYCEQLPDRANAVSLAPRVRDYFGSPAPHLEYRVGGYERRALDEAQDVAKRILATMGTTDIRSTGISYAGHQIGTDRMGTDSRSSVVDTNLRTRDVPDLYLVGSGCFVTASASRPTLTIAALAIRAAEHIASRRRPGSGPASGSPAGDRKI